LRELHFTLGDSLVADHGIVRSLDSIGIAGFSHDFKYLEGKESDVTAAFHALEINETSVFQNVLFLLAVLFPPVQMLPTKRLRLLRQLRKSLEDIADRLLANTRREKEDDVAEDHADKSIIGLLRMRFGLCFG
jgi:hypothetical protein